MQTNITNATVTQVLAQVVHMQKSGDRKNMIRVKFVGQHSRKDVVEQMCIFEDDPLYMYVIYLRPDDVISFKADVVNDLYFKNLAIKHIKDYHGITELSAKAGS